MKQRIGNIAIIALALATLYGGLTVQPYEPSETDGKAAQNASDALDYPLSDNNAVASPPSDR